jgi:hypothetical protein
VEAEIGQGHVRVLGAERRGFIKGGQHTGGERGEQLDCNPNCAKVPKPTDAALADVHMLLCLLVEFASAVPHGTAEGSIYSGAQYDVVTEQWRKSPPPPSLGANASLPTSSSFTVLELQTAAKFAWNVYWQGAPDSRYNVDPNWDDDVPKCWGHAGAHSWPAAKRGDARPRDSELWRDCVFVWQARKTLRRGLQSSPIEPRTVRRLCPTAGLTKAAFK